MRILGWLTGGLGASGALVAVAAALLLALSAAVAFHGWPDRLVPGGSGTSPIEIAIAHPAERAAERTRIPAVPAARPAVSSSSRVAQHRPGTRARALTRRAAARRGATRVRRRAGTPAPPAPRRPVVPTPSTGGGSPASGRDTRTTEAEAPSASPGTSGSAPGRTPGSTPGRPPVTTPRPSVPPVSVPPQAAQGAGQAVQGVTQTAGNAVQGVADGAAGAVAPVAPPVAGAVDQAGATVDQAVQQVGQVVGGIANGLGRGLGPRTR